MYGLVGTFSVATQALELFAMGCPDADQEACLVKGFDLWCEGFDEVSLFEMLKI